MGNRRHVWGYVIVCVCVIHLCATVNCEFHVNMYVLTALCTCAH